MLAVMLVTSKGAAGVSGSGLVALVATLAVMPDLPVAGVALLVGIDRFMSEARALTSVISNACAVIFVSMWEGACDRARLAQRLAAGGPVSPNGSRRTVPPRMPAATVTVTGRRSDANLPVDQAQ